MFVGSSTQVGVKLNLASMADLRSSSEPLPQISVGARVVFFSNKTVIFLICEGIMLGNSVSPNIDEVLYAVYTGGSPTGAGCSKT